MVFELNTEEKREFEIWSNQIKEVNGEYGQFVWTICHTGIGYTLKCKSELTDEELDLTKVEQW